MQLVDLTRTLDPTDVERMPEVVRPLAAVLAPKIEYLAPGAEGRDRMCAIFGCTPDDLPEREGWGEELVTMNSHSGTHVDAPLHYGSTCEGRPARTISEIRLEELYCDGMVLDLRGKCERGGGIAVESLTEAIAATGRAIREGDAVLLRTGQEEFDLDDIRALPTGEPRCWAPTRWDGIGPLVSWPGRFGRRETGRRSGMVTSPDGIARCSSSSS
jgi:hypothetical protein